MKFTFGRPLAACAAGVSKPKQLWKGFFREDHPFAKQLIITMNLTAILLLAACLQVSAATYSQTVSFTGKEVPLEQVFTAVKKQRSEEHTSELQSP